jgi:hypothetical protein
MQNYTKALITAVISFIVEAYICHLNVLVCMPFGNLLFGEKSLHQNVNPNSVAKGWKRDFFKVCFFEIKIFQTFLTFWKVTLKTGLVFNKTT